MVKFRKWFKGVLFLSSYAPLWLIFAILFSGNSFSILNYKIPHSGIFLSAFLLSFVVTLFMIYLAKTRSATPLNFESYQDRTDTLASYIIPYVFPFLSLEYSEPQGVLIFLIIFVSLMAIQIPSNKLFINPILSVLGYTVYDLESSEFSHSAILIASNGLNLTSETLKVVKLGHGVYIRKKGGILGWENRN